MRRAGLSASAELLFTGQMSCRPTNSVEALRGNGSKLTSVANVLLQQNDPISDTVI